MDISFIVTIYNKKKSVVERCLKSIKKMNDLSHEIIVIDDGSDTGMKDCYYKLSQKYNAQYYYQSNQGVSSARNLGIKKATGKYIFFVDCDDIVLNEKIVWNDLKDKPDLIIYDVLKEEMSTKKIEVKTLNSEEKTLSSSALASQLIKDGLMNWVYGKLYSIKFIKSQNIRFNTNIKTGEDLDFVVHVVENAKKIKYISKSVYKYEFEYTSGNGRIESYPEDAITDTNFVYQLRKELSAKYNLSLSLISVNEQQTLQTYFEIYSFLLVNHLMKSSLYEILKKNIELVESEGNIDSITKIKKSIVDKNLKLVAVIYYKIRKLYKIIGR